MTAYSNMSFTAIAGSIFIIKRPHYLYKFCYTQYVSRIVICRLYNNRLCYSKGPVSARIVSNIIIQSYPGYPYPGCPYPGCPYPGYPYLGYPKSRFWTQFRTWSLFKKNGILTKIADSATEQSTCVCVSYVHVQCRHTVVRHRVQCEV